MGPGRTNRGRASDDDEILSDDEESRDDSEPQLVEPDSDSDDDDGSDGSSDGEGEAGDEDADAAGPAGVGDSAGQAGVDSAGQAGVEDASGQTEAPTPQDELPLLERPLIVEGTRTRRPATTSTRHNYAIALDQPATEVTFQSTSRGAQAEHSTEDGYVRVKSLADPDPYGGRIRVGDRILGAGGVCLRAPLSTKQWTEACRRIRAAPLPMELIVEVSAATARKKARNRRRRERWRAKKKKEAAEAKTAGGETTGGAATRQGPANRATGGKPGAPDPLP